MSKKKKKLSPEGKPRIPVGSMCMVCDNKYSNCTTLPFDTYPIKIVDETHVMVVCKAFIKEPMSLTRQDVRSILMSIPELTERLWTL